MVTKKLQSGKKVAKVNGRTAYYFREDGSLAKPLLDVLTVFGRQSRPITFRQLANKLPKREPKTVKWAVGADHEHRDPSTLLGRGFVSHAEPIEVEGVKEYTYEITKSGRDALDAAKKAD
jgi:hypothetical protein